MALGSYMGVSFTVSDRRILTPSGLKGQGGSEWATHNRTGARARSQWIAPKLRKYSYDLLLRAQDGVNPRSTLRRLQSVQNHRHQRRVGRSAAPGGDGGVQSDADHRRIPVRRALCLTRKML